MSLRWNLQTEMVKKTMIQTRSTDINKPVEYHEGFGMTPAPVLDCTGPIAMVINVE
jgi:hypothetical protein